MTRKIRVMQIIDAMHVGGAENVVFNLVRGLDAARFDVAVRCTRALGVVATRLMDEGFDVRLAASTRRALRYLSPLGVQREIWRWRPDVVHSHGLPAMLHTGPLALVGGLPPWVHTFHYGNYGGLKHQPHRLEPFLASRATRLISVSESQRVSLVRTYGMAADAITTIYNGVAENPSADDGAFRHAMRAELGIHPDDIVVGCIAVLSEQKGITYLLQAAPSLLATDKRLRILIVGGGHLEQSLRREADAIKPGGRVTLTGWRSDAVAILPAIDVFVMPSLWEAMSMVLLEAMAAKRPIVVTDVGENRVVVEGGQCAVVIPPADAEAISRAVLGLIRDPDQAVAMAARAHRRYRSRFTIPHMVGGYELVYGSLVA